MTDDPDETLPAGLRADLDRLAALSTDEIYAELAREADEDHAFGQDQIRRGRDLFRNLETTLKRRVCPGYQHRMRDPHLTESQADVLAAAAVLASLVGSQLGPGVNAAVLAMLIVRHGVREWCEGFDPT